MLVWGAQNGTAVPKWAQSRWRGLIKGAKHTAEALWGPQCRHGSAGAVHAPSIPHTWPLVHLACQAPPPPHLQARHPHVGRRWSKGTHCMWVTHRGEASGQSRHHDVMPVIMMWWCAWCDAREHCVMPVNIVWCLSTLCDACQHDALATHEHMHGQGAMNGKKCPKGWWVTRPHSHPPSCLLTLPLVCSPSLLFAQPQHKLAWGDVDNQALRPPPLWHQPLPSASCSTTAYTPEGPAVLHEAVQSNDVEQSTAWSYRVKLLATATN